MIDEAIGTFNYAHSYWKAARHLLKNRWEDNETHPAAPMQFLYWHAIELFLKAYLQAEGVTDKELRKLSHKIGAVAQESIRHGLPLTKHSLDVISYMPTQDDVVALRYIRLGTTKVLDDQDLEAACCTIYTMVGAILQQRGIDIRFHADEILVMQRYAR